MLAEIVALVLLVALVAYTLTGGADFGGGAWDLFASGPRKDAQRALIARALAPIWEANHVWLVLIVVVLFVALPHAYTAITTALHIPLVLVLIGIVLRGAAFVFRSYDPVHGVGSVRWRRVFAIASLVTPVFLGVVLGAVVFGGVRLDADHRPIVGFVEAWLQPLPFLVGAFVLLVFAWLAAVYLTVEAEGDAALQDDFRRRALASGALAGVVSLVVLSAARSAGSAGHLAEAFGTAALALQITVATLAIGALAALWHRAYRRARILAAGQVTLVVVGLELALWPHVIAPDLTFAEALAPESAVVPMLVALAIGAPLLIAALAYLYRVFRRV